MNKETTLKQKEEKVYPMYSLSEEDFEGVAKERGLSIIGKDIDEIARQCKKGIEWRDDILSEMESVAKPLPDIFELIESYRELWTAVENGKLDEKFFELREKFRNIVG